MIQFSLLLSNFMNMEGWLVIVGLALLLFGPKKIPELMRGLGRGVGELQKGIEDGKRMLHDATNIEPTPPTPTTPTEPTAHPEMPASIAEHHEAVVATNPAPAASVPAAGPVHATDVAPASPAATESKIIDTPVSFSWSETTPKEPTPKS